MVRVNDTFEGTINHEIFCCTDLWRRCLLLLFRQVTTKKSEQQKIILNICYIQAVSYINKDSRQGVGVQVC